MRRRLAAFPQPDDVTDMHTYTRTPLKLGMIPPRPPGQPHSSSPSPPGMGSPGALPVAPPPPAARMAAEPPPTFGAVEIVEVLLLGEAAGGGRLVRGPGPTCAGDEEGAVIPERGAWLIRGPMALT